MIGIVIANYNGENLLKISLKSIQNQKYKDYRTYIIDNGSTDNSLKVINEYKKSIKITLIKNEANKGFAIANNEGIRQAIKDGCEYICTLNNDVELDSHALFNAAEYIKSNKQTHAFQLFMINYYNREIIDAAGIQVDKKLLAMPIGVGEKVKNFNFKDLDLLGPCAGAAIYSSEVLEKIKLKEGEYFDSKFFLYYEDVDLALRLRAANFNTELIEDAIVYHMYSATSNKLLGIKHYYSARNLFLYTKKNQEYKEYRRNFKSYIMIIMKRMVFSVINLKGMEVKNQFKGMLDGIKNI